jgi:hypothetical protein
VCQCPHMHSMQDLVDQISCREGSGLRLQAAQGLSGVLSWSLLLSWMALAVSITFKLGIHSVLSLFGRKPRGLGHVPGLKQGVRVMGMQLNGAAVRRAQLLAVLGFQKLWLQSWRAALASVWLGFRIFFHAVRLKCSRGQPTAVGAQVA